MINSNPWLIASIRNRIRIRNSEFMDPDQGDQLITDPPDLDTQHLE